MAKTKEISDTITNDAMLRIDNTCPVLVTVFCPITPFVNVAKLETWLKSKSVFVKLMRMISVVSMGVIDNKSICKLAKLCTYTCYHIKVIKLLGNTS